MLHITIVIIISYLIGSIPTAYLVVRYLGYDLRNEGSRNIGARNAFEVTSKKWVGIFVLIIDFLKGAFPLVILANIDAPCLWNPIAGAGLVIGHCYPIWLKFHGGRGLATGSAVILLLSPLHFVVWLVVYALTSLFKRQVHIQTVVATVGCIVFESVTDTNSLVGKARLLCIGDSDVLHYSLLVIFVTILSRHIEPIKAYFKTS